MRRSVSHLLGVLVVAALMAVSTVALAAVEQTQSYKDVFPDITYEGSAGSIRWENSWLEIGENDGPGEGRVRVYTGGCYDYKCLIIEGHGDVGTLGAKRYADLSFFEDADLCFDVVAQLEGDEKLSEGELSIQVTTDGQSWKTIDNFNLQNLSGNAIHRQRGLNNYLSEGFGIRFIVTGTLEGEVYVDNVEIKGLVVATTTSTTTSSTTSTTKPKEATTTTKTQATTTTTEREMTTTTERPVAPPRADTTTTTTAETTTTVFAAVPLGPTEPPTDSGLRETANGVQANYSQELFGAMEMGASEVLSVGLEANYSMAVEVFSATWIWMVALLLIIATAIVTGLDRRRPAKGQSAP